MRTQQLGCTFRRSHHSPAGLPCFQRCHSVCPFSRCPLRLEGHDTDVLFWTKHATVTISLSAPLPLCSLSLEGHDVDVFFRVKHATVLCMLQVSSSTSIHKTLPSWRLSTALTCECQQEALRKDFDTKSFQHNNSRRLFMGACDHRLTWFTVKAWVPCCGTGFKSDDR